MAQYETKLALNAYLQLLEDEDKSDEKKVETLKKLIREALGKD